MIDEPSGGFVLTATEQLCNPKMVVNESDERQEDRRHSLGSEIVIWNPIRYLNKTVILDVSADHPHPWKNTLYMIPFILES